MNDWLVALEATTLATALRGSVWSYPLVNAAHLLGVALLVGAIVPLDLKLLCVWRAVPLIPLWRVLTGAAAIGLIIAMVAGALLFSVRATDYTGSSFFLWKMALVAAGLLNALASQRRVRLALRSLEQPTLGMRISAGVSLCTWLTVLLLGRLIGYF